MDKALIVKELLKNIVPIPQKKVTFDRICQSALIYFPPERRKENEY